MLNPPVIYVIDLVICKHNLSIVRHVFKILNKIEGVKLFHLEGVKLIYLFRFFAIDDRSVDTIDSTIAAKTAASGP